MTNKAKEKIKSIWTFLKAYRNMKQDMNKWSQIISINKFKEEIRMLGEKPQF